jgi:hypothetical protein
MKKVSTAGAKQSRNISQQTLTLGLDLGDRNSWYCVLDEAGQIQLEQRVRTTANAQREVFGAMPRGQWHETRIPLTPTGLLMECPNAQNPAVGVLSEIGDVTRTSVFPLFHPFVQT